jgi:hypothetical protein
LQLLQWFGPGLASTFVDVRFPPVAILSVILLLPGGTATSAGESNATHPRCEICHFQTAGSSMDAKSTLPDASACLRCHETILPAVRDGGALPASLSRSIRRSHLAAGGGAEPMLTVSAANGSPSRFDCLTCHAAHPNGRPYQLLDAAKGGAKTGDNRQSPSTRLCLSCHGSLVDTRGSSRHYSRHPVGIAVRDWVPLPSDRFLLPLEDAAGTADPRDDVIACTTCHAVHAGSDMALLRWGKEQFREACGTCHRNKVDAPLPGVQIAQLN